MSACDGAEALQHADPDQGRVRALGPEERAHVCLRADGLRLRPYRQRAPRHRLRRAVPAAAPSSMARSHVTYVRNITDVDDKINARAAEEGVSIRDVTERTAKQYFEDVAALGALPRRIQPRATEYVRADDRDDRTAHRGRLCLSRRRSRAVRRRLEIRLRQALAPLARRDDRGRPRRGRAVQEKRDGLRACGSRRSPASRRGKARGAAAVPAGTSSARP